MIARLRRAWLRTVRRIAPASPAHHATARAPAPAAGRPTAVIAACYDFPIGSHTFVYQEVLGLIAMGFDVRIFCWRLGDPEHLHAAFTPLAERVQVLESGWVRHVRDYQHFRERMPARVSALMARLAASFGRPVAELEADYEILMAFTFAREVEAAGAAYIHTYFFYEETFFGLVASWLLDIPRGVTCYADHMLADSRFKDFRLQFERLDVAVATSRRIRDELVALAGERHADTILVKPNGVDGTRFRPHARRPRAGVTFDIISVCRIEPKKGLLHLCDAARRLADQGRAVRFHIIGAADASTPGSLEYEAAFRERITALGVDPMFVLYGFRRQEYVARLLDCVHAFVAPYVEVDTGDKDGIPTSLLEAMACGLPAICTDAGSIPEVIDDGVEGLLVPQRDGAALARAIARLIDEPDLAASLGHRARRRFEIDFDARVTEPRLHARIARVMGDRARPTHAGAA